MSQPFITETKEIIQASRLPPNASLYERMHSCVYTEKSFWDPKRLFFFGVLKVSTLHINHENSPDIILSTIQFPKDRRKYTRSFQETITHNKNK